MPKQLKKATSSVSFKACVARSHEWRHPETTNTGEIVGFGVLTCGKHSSFLLGLFFKPKDGGNMSFRNVG
jgi:hypothetical protein